MSCLACGHDNEGCWQLQRQDAARIAELEALLLDEGLRIAELEAEVAETKRMLAQVNASYQASMTGFPDLARIATLEAALKDSEEGYCSVCDEQYRCGQLEARIAKLEALLLDEGLRIAELEAAYAKALEGQVTALVAGVADLEALLRERG